MSTLPQDLIEKVAEVLLRVERLEKAQIEERSPSAWHYLVERPHSWRRQLYVKGRNMTAAQLVSSMNANGLNPFQAADDLDLPLAAVEEAVRYCHENAALLSLEAAEQRRRLVEKGYPVGPATLSG
ncbi:MAG TPA: hypothetical protein VG826_15920 [Pirellulales bacterium]|nr:hypothetical protein [Pirellulales bacterium]